MANVSDDQEIPSKAESIIKTFDDAFYKQFVSNIILTRLHFGKLYLDLLEAKDIGKSAMAKRYVVISKTKAVSLINAAYPHAKNEIGYALTLENLQFFADLWQEKQRDGTVNGNHYIAHKDRMRLTHNGVRLSGAKHTIVMSKPVKSQAKIINKQLRGNEKEKGDAEYSLTEWFLEGTKVSKQVEKRSEESWLKALGRYMLNRKPGESKLLGLEFFGKHVEVEKASLEAKALKLRTRVLPIENCARIRETGVCAPHQLRFRALS